MIQILKYHETILIFYVEYKKIFDHLLKTIIYQRNLLSIMVPFEVPERDFNINGAGVLSVFYYPDHIRDNDKI